MEATGADVFGLLVDERGIVGQGLDGVLGEGEFQAFGFEQGGVLLEQGVFGLGEDADEIGFAERSHFHADGQAALKLGDKVGGFGDVEGAGADKKDVVGADHAVARVDGGALDDRQDVALDALAGDIGAVAGLTAGDFVDLVDEDDAHLLGALDGRAGDLVHVNELVFFFLDEVVEGFGDGHFALLFLLAEEAGEHVLDIDVHLLDALAGDDFKGGHGALADFDFDQALVELGFAELGAEFVTGAIGGVCGDRNGRGAGGIADRCNGREQQVEDALFGGLLGALGDFVELFLADHINGGFDQVAHHGLDIAADVADFGVLGGFDLRKRTAGQAREAAGDFRFADAGGADHQDVFGEDFFGHFGSELLAADTVAQSNGDGALGGGLADNVFVELDDDLARGEFVEGRKRLGLLSGDLAGEDDDVFLFGFSAHG